MSGGSKPKDQPKKEEPSGTIPGTGPMMTQQPFIGDSQNMLAQQLAAGGYGSVPDLLTMLSQTYSPMQVLDTRPGAVAPPTTPTTGSGTPSWWKPEYGEYKGLRGADAFRAMRANGGRTGPNIWSKG